LSRPAKFRPIMPAGTRRINLLLRTAAMLFPLKARL
jgi:hypothetical protein